MLLQAAITASGRMSLPVDIRKQPGLTQDGMVYVEETEGGVMLQTIPQTVAYAQALAQPYPDIHGLAYQRRTSNQGRLMGLLTMAASTLLALL
jgi:hypothetical protein